MYDSDDLKAYMDVSGKLGEQLDGTCFLSNRRSLLRYNMESWTLNGIPM